MPASKVSARWTRRPPAAPTDPAPGLLGSERKCTAFDSFSAAKRAVTWQNRAALDAILIERIDPREIGGKIGIYADKKICTALGLTFLRMALAELVLHYASADDRVRERDSALS